MLTHAIEDDYVRHHYNWFVKRVHKSHLLPGILSLPRPFPTSSDYLSPTSDKAGYVNWVGLATPSLAVGPRIISFIWS